MLCSCYRRFVFSFSRIAAPLTEMMKNDDAFVWGADQQEAFGHLNNRPSGLLDRTILRLREHDITASYKSGRKHGDVDCLSRAAVEPAPAISDDYEETFLGTIMVR